MLLVSDSGLQGTAATSHQTASFVSKSKSSESVLMLMLPETLPSQPLRQPRHPCEPIVEPTSPKIPTA